MAKTCLVLLLLATTAIADDRIDALARAKLLCQQEKIKLVTTIHVADEYAAYDAVYYPDPERIEINLLRDHWQDTAKHMQEAHRTRFNSSSHPDHIIRHEIAHVRFFRKVGVPRAEELRKAAFPFDSKLVSTEVSTYAARDNIEFVAETYCGLQDGHKYSATIMDHYNSLWGK